MSKKRDTQGYGSDEVREPSGGVQITIRFPATVFNRLNITRKFLGKKDFRDVFAKAVAEYFKVLSLVVKGYKIFSGSSMQSDGIDLDPGVSRVDLVEEEDAGVIAEMQPRFMPEELKVMIDIQKLFANQVRSSVSVDEIIEESIAVLIWVVAKRSQGKKVFAARKHIRGAVELPFDMDTLLVKRA